MRDTVDPDKYLEMLLLQESLNTKLRQAYALNKSKRREHLANFLVKLVQELIDEINSTGYSYWNSHYGGDINFENSEHIYYDGKQLGHGFMISFRGFSVQITWEGKDKYQIMST